MKSIEIWTAPSTGRDGMTQCLHFKGIMRKFVGRDPNEAYMRTEHEENRVKIIVDYEPANLKATEWTFKVRELAEYVGEKVVNGGMIVTGRTK